MSQSNTYFLNGQFKFLETEKRSKPIAMLPELAAHDLNHCPQRSLGGENACRAYFGSERLSYPKRKRQEVYHWIRELAAEVCVRVGKGRITPAALAGSGQTMTGETRMIAIDNKDKEVKNGKKLNRD